MPEGWREIRLFISSTFRDMQAERNHLVRFVFPRVREKLLARRVRLVDVDLRWGVSADQDAFDLCMREIDLCRPRFLCMLGGRYGWVPPPKTLDSRFVDVVLGGTSRAGPITDEERGAVERIYQGDAATNVHRLREKPRSRQEVAQYSSDGNIAVQVLQRAGLPEATRSITAAEVLHGALDQLDRSLFRFFYFREPSATAAIPGSHAGDYREEPGSVAEQSLNALKARVADPALTARVTVAPGVDEMRPLHVAVYPAAWDSRTNRITGLEKLGAQVEEDLLGSIEAEFGAEVEPLEGFAAEAAAMEAFVETRVQRYVVGSREGAFQELRDHADSDDPPGIMVVAGEPGGGKSAMLARFIREYESRFPEHLVISHFVGASAASTNMRQLLQRLWHELVGGAGLSGEAIARIPDDWDKLREEFPEVLRQAASQRRVILVIDAVNQLDAAHQAHSMRWLPEEMPGGARAILSVVPGPAFDALQARRTQPRFCPIGRLNRDDATEIMVGFLDRYRKELDADQRKALLAKQDAGNPLYLLTALEELRTLGTYEEISERIAALPGTTVPLFEWIFRRLEQDDGFRDRAGVLIGQDLVRRYCSYLAVGRSGMAESELAELVAPAQPGEDTADALGNVAALNRLLRPYLMYRGNLIDFFHGQIREAANTAYLGQQADRRSAHQQIAAYFRGKADPAHDLTWPRAASYPRAIGELPYHLTEGQEWHALFKVLTDFGFLEAKCTYVAVQETAEGTRYGGVYELQEDYRRAQEVFPEDFTDPEPAEATGSNAPTPSAR